MDRRWVVLAAFSLVAALSQLLWLNFAPSLTLIESQYDVTEMQANLLVLVFPLIYVILALPAGAFIAKHGIARAALATGLGTMGMFVGMAVGMATVIAMEWIKGDRTDFMPSVHLLFALLLLSFLLSLTLPETATPGAPRPTDVLADEP